MEVRIRGPDDHLVTVTVNPDIPVNELLGELELKSGRQRSGGNLHLVVTPTSTNSGTIISRLKTLRGEPSFDPKRVSQSAGWFQTSFAHVRDRMSWTCGATPDW